MPPVHPRALEALTLLCRGLSNQQIADRMFIQEQTVRNHLTTVYQALDDAGLARGIHHKRSYLAYLTGLADGLKANKDADQV